MSWCFNSKKAITALLSYFQRRIPVEKCSLVAILLWMSFQPIILYSALPHPSPPPIIQPSALFSGRPWALLSVWLLLYHFFCWIMLVQLWSFVQEIIQLVFFIQFTENAFHICFLSSDSLHDGVCFFKLTYLTPVVVGRNVLKLKRNMHQPWGPECLRLGRPYISEKKGDIWGFSFHSEGGLY